MLKTFEGLYARKEHDEAIRFLLTHKKSVPDGLLNFNLGTVYAQKKNMPLARYHLLQAEKNGFTHESLNQNLKLVEDSLNLIKLEKSYTPLDHLIKTGIFISDGILVTFALLVVVTGLWMSRTKPGFKTITLMISILILIAGLNLWLINLPTSIVIASQPILDGPSSIFTTKEELPVGLMIVTSNEGEWKKIIFPSRFQGWIKNTGLKELEL